jgi:hypothetical protein
MKKSMWTENWKTDWRFKKWLEEEKLNTDERPLDNNTLELIHHAWRSGCRYGERGWREWQQQMRTVGPLGDMWP